MPGAVQIRNGYIRSMYVHDVSIMEHINRTQKTEQSHTQDLENNRPLGGDKQLQTSGV